MAKAKTKPQAPKESFVDPFKTKIAKPASAEKRDQGAVALPEEHAHKIALFIDLKQQSSALADKQGELAADLKQLGLDLFCERAVTAKDPQTLLLSDADGNRLKFYVKNQAGKIDRDAVAEEIGESLTKALLAEDKNNTKLNLPAWEANMPQILKALNATDADGKRFLSPEVLGQLFISGGYKPVEGALKLATEKAKDADHLAKIIEAIGLQQVLGG